MKLRTIIISLFVVGTLQSCLNVQDPKNLSTSSFWQTPRDGWSALNACYSSIIPGCEVYNDAYMDNVRCPYPWESNSATYKVDGLSPGTGGGYDFTAIRQVNVFLANIKNIKGDNELIKRMIAEARVLRAMAYLSLTLDYGKVPIILEPIPYSTPSLKRNSVAEVHAFILKELTEAAKDLPTKYSGGFLNEKTRITKYAAIALKARAAIYFNDFSTAEAAAKDVMENGGYSLHTLSVLPANISKEKRELELLYGTNPNKEALIKGVFSYRSIWDADNVTADSPECILVKEYLPNNPDYADLVRYTNMRPDQMVVGWSSVVPLQNLVDAYWTAEGATFTPPTVVQRAVEYEKMQADLFKEMGSQYTFDDIANKWIDNKSILNYKYMDEFKDRDPRLYASILFPFKALSDTDAGSDFVYQWKHGKGVKNESTTGFNFIKMVAKNSSTLLWGTYPMSEANFPVIRYSEILLIFAEAHTYNVGYDMDVQNALNLIRDRVGMPHVPSGLGKEDGIALIRNERRIELAGEGQRYYDMRRYDEQYINQHMNNVNITQPDGTVVLTMKWSDRMRLMPIPQSAIDLNPDLSKDQNPGY